ncbi:MAG: O-acetylhomoserine aminocarboxypropyltransferase/cysteine synthase [Chloroflexi bacterium]|nr:O-acetylhomoserine aminocarboxypropyltransferase/cysteine synthase [Chloroflexota bacterium]
MTQTPAVLEDRTQEYKERGAQIADAEARQRQRMRHKHFDTIAVHGLYSMEAALANQGSINEPAYFSSAQHFENSDHMEVALSYQMPAWAYSRLANPTLHYLEETVALLEGYGFPGEVSACATGSGMSAVFMATQPFLAENGRPINIVASAKCYGGTFMLFSQRYAVERGIDVRWVADPLDNDEWASRIDADTRLVFGEMPSNPGLNGFDIAAVAELAHAHHAPLIVDSTVATAALLRPFLHGADIVVHSMSKSMGSSGMAIAGAVVARHNIHANVGTDALRENFAMTMKLLPFRDFGPAISPFNALMILNDLRTLRTRMDVLSRNSLRIAEFLEAHSQVKAVHYPGLPSSREHASASKVMWLADGEDDYGAPVNRYGHLMSFQVRGDRKRAAGALRPAGDDLAGDGSGPDQERGHYPDHLHAPAAGRRGADAGRHPGQLDPAERRRRTPRRHHGRSGSGPAPDQQVAPHQQRADVRAGQHALGDRAHGAEGQVVVGFAVQTPGLAHLRRLLNGLGTVQPLLGQVDGHGDPIAQQTAQPLGLDRSRTTSTRRAAAPRAGG